MSDDEWDRVYREAWARFYTFEHMEVVLRRMTAFGSNKKFTTVYRLLWYRDFPRLYGCHPLEGGFFRVRRRKDRRPGMNIENPLVFYPKHWLSEARNVAAMCIDYLRLRRMMLRIWNDPERYAYRDLAMTSPGPEERTLALYVETRGGVAEFDRSARQKRATADARAEAARQPRQDLKAG
jgi:hypothetical protein